MNGLQVFFVAFSLQIFQALPAIAQVQIVPANNGTGTIVLPNGNRIDITGGTTSGNGANVFHSFQGFNVQTGQTANFVVLPQTQNVLGGVTGGNPSLINGTIQVTGSNANLYLLNPAGFIFGNNAQLNVNGSFTASTARTAWFGDRNLDIYNPNYTNLTGNLTALEFDPNNPAAIVNSGNLSVGEGKSVNLAASTVVNTGTVSAPNGSVGIVAIPDGRLRLNVGVEGLSFEFPQPKDAQGNALPVKALDLPSLLTTGKLDSSTGISLNSQGQAQLTASQTVIPNTAGTAIISGTVSVASPVANPSQVPPKIQILGDRVGLVGANIDASGVNGGGSVFIGGDFQGKGVIPNALMTFVSADSTIKADALQSGNGGRVIVWADNATRFFGSISARGGAISGDGGFVEVSGKQNLVFDGKVDLNAAIGKGGTLLLDPTNIYIDGVVSDSILVPDPLEIFASNFLGQDITISQATLASPIYKNSNIILEATNNITISSLINNQLIFPRGSGNITFTADSDKDGVGTFSMPFDAVNPQNGATIFAPSPLNQPIGRTLSIYGASVTLGIINTRGGIPAPGGSLFVNANGDIIIGAAETYADSSPVTNPYNGGNITIISDNGSIDTSTGILSARAAEGNGGNITLTARGNIKTAALLTDPVFFGTNNRGGDISIISQTGSVDISTNNGYEPLTGARNGVGLYVGGQLGGAGKLVVNAFGDITTNFIQAASNGNANSLTLTSQTGKIDTLAGDINAFANGIGGTINFTAPNGISTKNISTGGVITSGSVNLRAITGNITTTSIDTTSLGLLGGNAGSISIDAGGSATIDGLLRAFSQSGNGANVSVKANNGNILFSCAIALGGKCGVESYPEGSASAVTPSTVRSAGNISIVSTNGSITLLNTAILDAGADSASISGTGTDKRASGTVTISAQGDITTGLGGITSDASFLNGEPASNISINSSQGKIRAYNITTNSFDGRGGDVVFSAPNGISVNSVITGDSRSGSSGGNITFNGKVELLENTNISAGTVSSGNVVFTSTIDGANILNIISNTATVDFQGAIGSITPLTGLTITAQNTTLKGDVTTADSNITINSLLTPTASSTLNAGTGTISLNGGFNTGSNAVSVIADQINLTAPITGTSNLILKPSSVNRNIVLGDTDSNSFSLTSTAIAAITGVKLAIGDSSVGSISVTAPITFNTSATLISPVLINLNADITTTGQTLTLTGNTRLGTNIAINSSNGDISTNGTINSLTGNNFGLTLNAGTGNINLNGALGASDRLSTISLNASNISISGGINTVNGLQISNPTTITGTSTLSTLNGDINIGAPISIQSGTAANLTINSPTGNVTTQDINLASAVGAGNSLTLLSPQGIVTTGNLNVNGISGGNITIQALTSITTGTLSAVGLSGNGGNIFLDPLLDIFTGAINAQGFGGVGGTVDLTSNRFVRISGTFIDQNGLVASVSTAGTAGDGIIIIRHDGGTRFEPFNVFSSLINGTDGVLTTGAGNTIFTPRAFPGPYTQGNIQIITAPNFTVFLATQPLKEPPRVQWVDEGDRSPFPPEEFYTREFENFFRASIPDLKPVKIMTLAEIQETLRRVQRETGVNPALLYVTFLPDRMGERNRQRGSKDPCYNPKVDPNAQSPTIPNLEITKLPDSCDILELTLVTAKGKPIYIPVKVGSQFIRRRDIVPVASELRNTVANFAEGLPVNLFEKSSQQLYNWIVRPIKDSLQDQKIKNLTFVLPNTLQKLPFAALQDHQAQYIIKDYSVGLMPSLSLTDTRRSRVNQYSLRFLGASKFNNGQADLDGVEDEAKVVSNIWKVSPLLNNDFTKDNLADSGEFGIVHLATHAEFEENTGVGRIDLPNTSVTLNQIRDFNWKNVELLVLSACQTSEGNSSSELGFAGAAVRSNVKSVVGTLWKLTDAVAPQFMETFYQELKNESVTIKAEAFRRAQVSITQSNLSHPKFWSALTIVGNPW
ncbi:CHAT domain-containing protein [Pseudanabaena sp. BC1403]|uniref:CHAT domain-containing protein n=1 Tax=Pseudanabaena sp. BC1403 TaxID=2043171 RepID=UPI0015E19B72|nr:CHAT domain-containing protein [Pseudanabaena sp. BC1403]